MDNPTGVSVITATLKIGSVERILDEKVFSYRDELCCMSDESGKSSRTSVGSGIGFGKFAY